MQERTVAVRGGMFQTQVIEDGAGAPLLYLHGVDGVCEGDPFLARLAQRHHVVAPMLPGFGASSGTEQLRDIHDLIYYQLDLLDALGLRGLPVVGHSLGGMIAAELAAVQPERLSALVLIDAFGLWNPQYPVADFFVMSPKDLAAATYYDADSPIAKQAAEAPESNEAYVAFALERAKSLATAAKYLWPLPNRGLAARAHRISAPTLVLWGEADKIAPPQYAQEFKALIPQAEIEIVPKAGHLPQVEQLDATVEAIDRFLARHPGGK
jgi:pimeloyl-ACP methyl ester carboxylesterase